MCIRVSGIRCIINYVCAGRWLFRVVVSYCRYLSSYLVVLLRRVVSYRRTCILSFCRVVSCRFAVSCRRVVSSRHVMSLSCRAVLSRCVMFPLKVELKQYAGLSAKSDICKTFYECDYDETTIITVFINEILALELQFTSPLSKNIDDI